MVEQGSNKNKELNRLRTDSYRYRVLPNHPSHSELRKLSNTYGKVILCIKRQHWASYLEEMTACDIWTANKYLREPAGEYMSLTPVSGGNFW